MKSKRKQPVDLLQFVPGAGGFVHGAVSPMRGHGRLSSAMTQGTGGLVGGLVGAGMMNDVDGGAGLGALIGAGLGTAAGSWTSRKLHEHNVADTISQSEILELLRQLEAGYRAHAVPNV